MARVSFVASALTLVAAACLLELRAALAARGDVMYIAEINTSRQHLPRKAVLEVRSPGGARRASVLLTSGEAARYQAPLHMAASLDGKVAFVAMNVRTPMGGWRSSQELWAVRIGGGTPKVLSKNKFNSMLVGDLAQCVHENHVAAGAPDAHGIIPVHVALVCGKGCNQNLASGFYGTDIHLLSLRYDPKSRKLSKAGHVPILKFKKCTDNLHGYVLALAMVSSKGLPYVLTANVADDSAAGKVFTLRSVSPSAKQHVTWRSPRSHTCHSNGAVIVNSRAFIMPCGEDFNGVDRVYRVTADGTTVLNMGARPDGITPGWPFCTLMATQAQPVYVIGYDNSEGGLYMLRWGANALTSQSMVAFPLMLGYGDGVGKLAVLSA